MTTQPSKLDEDLLWQTFSFVTNMGEESDEKFPVLVTLRNSSQVCSTWRNLILSTSSWWARNLNLRLLNQKSNDWRNEVLRRTGEALLHITGPVRRENVQFVEAILTEHWARIQVLRLYASHSIDLLQYIQQPAPFLEVFKIPEMYTSRDEQRLANPQFRLFDNSAPSLQCFYAFTRAFATFVHAPFLSQLRRLRLWGTDLTPRQLLDVLGTIRSLEELDGGQIIEGTDDTNFLPLVSLPRLRHISLDGENVRVWLAVVSNIVPAQKCVLLATLLHQDELLQLTDLASTLQTLSRYSHRQFESESATGLSLHLYKRGFKLQHRHIAPARIPNLLSFCLIADSALSTHMVSTILKLLATCNFSVANSLDLKLEQLEGILDLADPSLGQLLFSLPSVETLMTHFPTFKLLLDLPATHANVLISLRKINYQFLEATPELMAFLHWRKRVGYPIKVLDVTTYTVYDEQNRDFRILDTLPGLKVTWKVEEEMMEYLCGSGNPEILNFPPVVSPNEWLGFESE
ncbi:hypothetical protein GALMADRAFT_159902 [Galerina marginata CBS 339.88]|uniref:F-box domain-containing protein n=1 Tax=Galerina marginata (strain CBS 339.88) TaxID=685588 RepID=A0A067SKA0_GALM3|nr:hypothetical protein GALMADRAFT_159902 [Galerina marginata CBS 339.88]